MTSNQAHPLTTIAEGVPLAAEGPRDSDLATIYAVFNHPKAPGANRRSLVYLADLTDEGCLKALQTAGRQRIPKPGLEAAKQSGASLCHF